LHQGENLGRFRAGILQPVRNAARQENAITSAHDFSLVADDHLELTGKDVKSFILATVHVKRRSRAWSQAAMVQRDRTSGIGSAKKPLTGSTGQMAFAKGDAREQSWVQGLA
jgi:hypothetical protein